MAWLVWIALAVAVLAVIAALVRALREALLGWRSYKRFRRGLGKSLHELELSVGRFAENAAKQRPTPELDQALARLSASTARLNVLRRAISDVTDSVSRITAVYPRK